MQEKLKKIKELLGNAIDDSSKKDLYIGQAIGHIDSILIDNLNKTSSNELPIPNHVWEHVEKPSNQNMMDAVHRHKEIHDELSKNSISQQNTQFEQLK
jgi:hypothetical protein